MVPRIENICPYIQQYKLAFCDKLSHASPQFSVQRQYHVNAVAIHGVLLRCCHTGLQCNPEWPQRHIYSIPCMRFFIVHICTHDTKFKIAFLIKFSSFVEFTGHSVYTLQVYSPLSLFGWNLYGFRDIKNVFSTITTIGLPGHSHIRFYMLIQNTTVNLEVPAFEALWGTFHFGRTISKVF